jgi:heme oxygenase
MANDADITTIDRPPSRAKRLEAATADIHDRLDRRIMASAPFDSRENYTRFVQVQRLFHRDIDALYRHASVEAMLPGLDIRGRLALIEQDLADLGTAPAEAETAPAFDERADLPTALGWLFVAEGSTLGAHSLLRRSAALGLSEDFGARHLAPHPNGRGVSWRGFTAMLDGATLSADEWSRVETGAQDAFARVLALAEALLPGPAAPDAAQA